MVVDRLPRAAAVTVGVARGGGMDYPEHGAPDATRPQSDSDATQHTAYKRLGYRTPEECYEL